MLDIKTLLEDIKKAPYRELTVFAPHSGNIEFVLKDVGTKVKGVSGTWKEKPGTLLAYLVREGNKKPIFAPEKGEVVEFCGLKDGQFVQAGTPLLKIRHFLTRQEVIDIILQKALSLFLAPEKGKYYFVSDVDRKIKSKGCQAVNVKEGDEILILSRMKRETIIPYQGPEGIIYALYFKPGQSVDAAQPLIGVCPQNQLEQIKDVVARIQTEWEEGE